MFEYETTIDINPKVGNIEELSEAGAILGFRPANPWLSNFHPAPVMAFGITFPTVEHAYVACKVCPGSTPQGRRVAQRQREEIRLIGTAGQVKRFGRSGVKLRTDWEDVKISYMRALTDRKYEIPELAALLIATEGRHIYEMNKHRDTFFGVVAERGEIVGRNVLGEILVDKRTRLIAERRPAGCEM